jgi:hypothetical protein
VNKLALVVMLVSATAFADPPPPAAASPFVVAYQPPPEVDRAHHGLTLELALGAGTTSVDSSAGSVTFAIGGWLSHDVALAFRMSRVGSYEFAGGSLQYYATPVLWFGAGGGSLIERSMDEFGGTASASGGGGFVRAGFNFAGHGTRAFYVSGELQGGSIDDQTHGVALVALGYQML